LICKQLSFQDIRGGPVYNALKNPGENGYVLYSRFPKSTQIVSDPLGWSVTSMDTEVAIH
jgi:hypothetical protein